MAARSFHVPLSAEIRAAHFCAICRQAHGKSWFIDCSPATW